MATTHPLALINATPEHNLFRQTTCSVSAFKVRKIYNYNDSQKIVEMLMFIISNSVQTDYHKSDVSNLSNSS